MMSHQQLLETLIAIDRISVHLARADRIVCMSQVLKEACEHVGIPAEKIVVLGNRVSLSRFRPAEQPNYDPRVLRALFIGRLQPQKNVHGLAQALALVKAQGWQIRLDICGGIRMNRYLRQALSVLEASDWHYWGTVPNRQLPARYHAADMYAGPSLFEGFQIPLIEALACGKPCVASRQAPASEIIDAEVGALVDPDDPSDIARGLLELKSRLNDPGLRRGISEACRRRAIEHWSYQAISAREAELYFEVLEACRGRDGQPSRRE